MSLIPSVAPSTSETSTSPSVWQGYRPREYNSSKKVDPSKVEVWACLIMRDEERNVPSCFSDLSPLVDGFVVSDTGSLDGSVQKAKECAEGKELELFESTWVNYSHNRNLVMRRMDKVARRRASAKVGLDLNSPLKWEEYQRLMQYRWFALVTDLDNRFHHCKDGENEAKGDEMRDTSEFQATVGSKGAVLLDRSSLVDDGYFIESRRGGAIYRTHNLMRVDPLGIERWCYVRSVHEYCDTLEPWADMRVGEVEGCYIDYGCSGYRSRDTARALRDVIHLLRDERLEPGDSRTTFYLAQSYNEAGCVDKARHYYQKRAEMANTWSSERYLSYLKLADLVNRKEAGGDLKYLQWLCKGFELGLKRLEIGYRICEYYRLQDLHRMAWSVGRTLINVTSVDSSEFLIDQAVNGWKFWDTLGVSAYYAGEKYYSYMLTLRALNYSGLNEGERKRLESNLRLVEGALSVEEKERAKCEAEGRSYKPSSTSVNEGEGERPVYIKLLPGEGTEGILKALLVNGSLIK